MYICSSSRFAGYISTFIYLIDCSRHECGLHIRVTVKIGSDFEGRRFGRLADLRVKEVSIVISMQSRFLFGIRPAIVNTVHIGTLLREHHLNTVELLCKSVNNYTNFGPWLLSTCLCVRNN